MTLENDPLVVKWINKLGLQDVPIEVRYPLTENNRFGLYNIELHYNLKGFVIQFSRSLPLWASLHKLGYIYIAKSSSKLEEFKETLLAHTQEALHLQSIFFDCVIESYFRRTDKEYQKARGLQVFTHASSYYDEWLKDITDNSIVDICYFYISDYLNFLYVMPEYYKNKLYKIVIERFNKTKKLILEKAKTKGLKFNIGDFTKIHDLLLNFELKLDYDYLIGNIDKLKEILSEINVSGITWN